MIINIDSVGKILGKVNDDNVSCDDYIGITVVDTAKEQDVV